MILRTLSVVLIGVAIASNLAEWPFSRWGRPLASYPWWAMPGLPLAVMALLWLRPAPPDALQALGLAMARHGAAYHYHVERMTTYDDGSRHAVVIAWTDSRMKREYLTLPGAPPWPAPRARR